MEDVKEVVKLQKHFMNMTKQSITSIMDELSSSKFGHDPQFLARTVLFCVQFRSNQISIYVELASLLCEKVPEVRAEFLAPFHPHRVKYFPFLYFMQRSFLAGLFTSKEIVDRISDFVFAYPNEVISRAYLFYYFAPLIHSENRKLYDTILTGLQKNVGAFGVFYEIREFVQRVPELSANWKQYWEDAALSYPSGSLAAIVRSDNLDSLRQKIEDGAVDIDEDVKLHSYENIVFPEVNPKVVEFAAYYGATNIFHFLLEKGIECELRRPRVFSFIHFAIAGGYQDFIAEFEAKGCSYDGTLITAAQWHYNELFYSLYETKDKSVNLELLLESAASNNVEIVMFCLDHGINVNEMNEDNEGALHFAAKNGCVDVIRYLVALPETDVNLGIGHRTPLHIASFRGFDQVVEALMSRSDLDVNAVSSGSGGTPLQEAAKAGHLAVVRALLKREDIDVNGYRMTALQQAITHSAAPVAVYLVTVKGVDVKVKDTDGRNCIHLAAVSGKPEIVSALLAHPELAALANEKDSRGQTPLHLAASQPLSDCISAFIDSGVALDFMIADNDGNTPLHLAARNGSARSITKMLAISTVNVNVKNLHGDTPLHFAAKRCRLQPLKALISSKLLDVNLQNDAGQSPLHWMMSSKPLDGFTLFLSQPGLDFNLRDGNGEPPIHIAAKSIHSEALARVALDDRFDPNICDNNGQNTLHKAAKSSSPESLRTILKRHGLEINKQDNSGISPLHFAARSRESSGVQSLLAMPNIQPSLTDVNGQTALHYACAAGAHNIIRCLLETPGIDRNARDNSGKTPQDLLPRRDRERNEQLFTT